MASGAVRELIAKIKFMMDKASESKANQSVQKLKSNLEKVGSKITAPKVSTQSINTATTAVGRLKQKLESLSQTKASVNIKPPKVSGGAFGNELMGGLGMPMGMSAGAVAGGLAASGILAAGAAAAGAVKKFAEFDATMSKVKALTGATKGEMDILTQTARKLGASTKYSATEAAQAMTYLGMAGWKTQDMVSAMPGLLDLTAASGEDLARVADIVSDDLTAFKMPADQAGHFADMLAVASSKANTNVSMMGETFKYVGPLAGSMGYSIEDMALATGIMANSSIKGEQAGTTLRALITRLVKPTKESAEAMDRLGISVKDSDGKMKPFRQIIKDMRAGFAKLTEAEKGEVAAMLAGQEAMSGTLALANESQGKVDELTGALDKADGAAHNMAGTMNDNLIGSLKELQSQAEETALIFGGALEPKVREAVNGIRESLKGLTDNTLTPFFELLAGPQGDSMASFKKYNELAAQHPTMMKFVEMFQIMGDNLEKTGESIESLGQKLESAFGNETVQKGLQLVIDAYNQLQKVQGNAIDDFGVMGATPLGQLAELIKKGGEAVIGGLGAAAEKLGELVVEGVQKLGELAEEVANTADGMIKGFGNAVDQINTFFNDMAANAIDKINSILDGLVNIEVMSDRVRIRLGNNAAAYSSMSQTQNNVWNVTSDQVAPAMDSANTWYK